MCWCVEARGLEMLGRVIVLESGRCRRGLKESRCARVCRDGRGFEVGHRWVSILTYSRTFAMLYLLWTGDALAAALAATACKTWCTSTGHANGRGMCGRARVVLKAGGRACGVLTGRVTLPALTLS